MAMISARASQMELERHFAVDARHDAWPPPPQLLPPNTHGLFGEATAAFVNQNLAIGEQPRHQALVRVVRVVKTHAPGASARWRFCL